MAYGTAVNPASLGSLASADLLGSAGAGGDLTQKEDEQRKKLFAAAQGGDTPYMNAVQMLLTKAPTNGS